MIQEEHKGYGIVCRRDDGKLYFALRTDSSTAFFWRRRHALIFRDKLRELGVDAIKVVKISISVKTLDK